MKQHWAALAALAMILAPGAVLAGSISASARVVDYNSGTNTVTVSSTTLAEEKLQILAGTTYRFIDCPDLFPAGSSCSYDASKWNLGRFRNESPEYFRKLLGDLAAHGCNIEYERTDSADTSGAYGAVSVRPAP